MVRAAFLPRPILRSTRTRIPTFTASLLATSTVDLLRPFEADQMQAWMVSADVGNVRNNRPDVADAVKYDHPKLL